MTINSTKNNIRIRNIIFCILILFLIIRRAWVSDDAFISLRTVDNFVNGYGLTWNTDERVQSYTHPLWMFLITLFYFFSREPFYTVLFISIFISILTLFLLFSDFSKNDLKVFVVFISLSLSRAFIDYSTSGLENPLSNFLITVFLVNFLKSENDFNRKNIIKLSLISSLGILNRLDLALFFIPFLFFILLKGKKCINVGYIMLGQLPFIIWTIFVVIYYGYLIPNTAFAKLPVGIPKQQIITQGITYFSHSLKNDPVTMIMIFTPLLLSLFNYQKKTMVVSLGITFYLLYIIWIGGDFMEGRFFTVPLIASLITFMNIPIGNRYTNYAIFAVVLIIGLSIPYNTFTYKESNEDFSSRGGIEDDGIADERFYYLQGLSLLSRYRGHMHPEHDWISIGQDLEKNNVKVTITTSIGMVGYYASPKVHIIDECALADPLLSRLPLNSYDNWRIGHFKRKIPSGYVESILTNINLIKNPCLQEYYEKVRIITRGDIFTWERIKTIIEMNIGKYNYLLQCQDSE